MITFNTNTFWEVQNIQHYEIGTPIRNSSGNDWNKHHIQSYHIYTNICIITQWDDRIDIYIRSIITERNKIKVDIGRIHERNRKLKRPVKGIKR